MKLLLIRHGDPDYSIDSLTEKGWREAGYLAERMARANADYYYVSPMGRAKATASCTLEALQRTAVECPWLEEFNAPIYRPDAPERRNVPWDWLPQDWMGDERFFLPDQWYLADEMQEGRVKEAYDRVVGNFDALLERHGYRREGRCYRAVHANNDTLAFFCHLGVGCVLLSHLLNLSPMILWHGACAAPSSVTTLATEERREGIVSFRMSAYGDISHLYAHNEPPSFMARFRECYANEDERRD